MSFRAAFIGWLAALLLGLASFVALAQRGPGAKRNAVPSRGVTPAKDAIFARKILMNTIAENMDEIETMLAPGGKFEVAEGREHADLISVMLMAFPHMFPPNTNQWRQGAERDAALDTYASPDVWENFPDFYARANAMSKVALEAAKAPTFKEYKAKIAELRTGCDACHALYMKIDK